MRFPKPKKGQFWMDRREARKTLDAEEDANKRRVRRRDRVCRWPQCQNCRRFTPRLEVAHVVRAKGMGGDHGTVSSVDDMMLLDAITHGEQERHERDVVPLSDRGTSGPCEFWAEDANGRPYLVAREIAPFILERD